MPKRTKKEALERLDNLPSVDLPFHSKVPGVAHAANAAYEQGKRLARGLVYLDPLNRLADDVITIPIPMIAIPAHESHLLSGSPSMQIYIRAGETIMPTGGAVRDYSEGVEEAEAMQGKALSSATRPKMKNPTRYQRTYSRTFNQIKKGFQKKDGTWKKDGFKNCVKKAHRLTKSRSKLA